MKIRDEAEYRRILTELQHLEGVARDTPEFRRRMDLLAATAEFELRFEKPKWRKGRPG